MAFWDQPRVAPGTAAETGLGSWGQRGGQEPGQGLETGQLRWPARTPLALTVRTCWPGNRGNREAP